MKSKSGNGARVHKATITDVARVANVSVGTVSRYLNGQELRRSNREQIERAISDLSYRKSAIATAMKSENTMVIGFLVPRYDEFHAKLLEKVVRLFRSRGYKMLTYFHGDDPTVVEEVINYFSDQRVDALVLAGLPNALQVARELAENGTPVVVYNNDMLGLNVDRVFVDNYRASKAAVDHLFDINHKKIGIISGNLQDSTGKRRFDGYVDAHKERGIEVSDSYVYMGGWNAEGGYAGAAAFMSLPNPPTAIFSTNYMMTYGLLEWLSDHSNSAHPDVAIVSFDDVEAFRLVGQGISAIAQPIERIAESIVTATLNRLSGEEQAATTTRTIRCDFILRGSSKPPVAPNIKEPINGTS